MNFLDWASVAKKRLDFVGDPDSFVDFGSPVITYKGNRVHPDSFVFAM